MPPQRAASFQSAVGGPLGELRTSARGARYWLGVGAGFRSRGAGTGKQLDISACTTSIGFAMLCRLSIAIAIDTAFNAAKGHSMRTTV